MYLYVYILSVEGLGT